MSGASPSLFLTVAYGDGIGPELMEAVLFLLKEARIGVFVESVEIGKRYYENGVKHGMSPQTIPLLKRTGLLLKAPHIMPMGEYHVSPQQHLSEHFAVMAKVAPIRSFSPLISTAYPERDLLVVRGEKTIEDDAALLRLACQVAHKHGYTSLHWHGNILPDPWASVQSEFASLRCSVFGHVMTDKTLTDLHRGVVVTRDMDESLIRRLSTAVSGSPSLGCIAHLAPEFGLFEPLHDAQNRANPIGMLRAASLMLLHIGKPEHAAMLDNAWLRTLEDGIYTDDLTPPVRRQTVGALAFAQAVADRLGETPVHIPAVSYPEVAVAMEQC